MRLFAHSVCLIVATLLLAPSGLLAENNAPSQTAKTQSTDSVTWAEIVISGSYPEAEQGISLFGATPDSLHQTLTRIERAAKDAKISGVVIRINSAGIGWGKVNEFRHAINKIKKAGKHTIAMVDAASTKSYVIATACDEIIMPESGTLMVLGLRSEVSFYKGLLDLLNVKADILRVGEYKSAAEPYTRTEMSPQFREEMEAILDDYFEQLVATIADTRKLDKEKVTAAIDNGPYTAKAAKELGLIDHVAYEDELGPIIRGKNKTLQVKLLRSYGKKKSGVDLTGPFGMINLLNMIMGSPSGTRRTSTPKIAVIYATGMIMPGKSTSSIFGASVMGSDTIIKAIKTAKDDDSVKAILLRVDSPGGSALASDLMWRALEKCGKPVIVSMGDTAASGGYYISMGADRIFAEPGTLTGSIGVVGGKMGIRGLFKKVGITTSVVQRGKNAGIESIVDGFSDNERKAMTKLLYDIYDQFTQKAAAGRKMKHEDLEKLARGRVYTGSMALKIGLVDELGTMEDAFVHAVKVAGLKPEDKVERLVLPKPVSPFEQLFGMNPSGASMQSRMLSETIKDLPPELAAPLKSLSLFEVLIREPRLTVLPYQLNVR
ncbi:MAG: signal peptide peptidase SppA [Planctomycetaceae bacterium]|nr:signal peptide peptidase SppA [Planctomycetaceae bacterium]